MNSSIPNLEQVEKQIDAAKRIQDKVKNEDFDWGLLLPQKEKSLHLGYLIAAITSYFVATGLIIFYNDDSGKAYKIIFSVGLMSVLWLACCAHLRFKKATVTSMASIIPAIIFFVSSGILTPEEAVDDIKGALGQDTSGAQSQDKVLQSKTNTYEP